MELAKANAIRAMISSYVMTAVLVANPRNEIAKMRIWGYSLHQMTKIDEIDAHILRVLSNDGRISNLDLAERVHLSPSACLRRVAALEKSGVILGYRAVLDPIKRGVGFTAYLTVGLSAHTKQAQEAFERAIASSDEVRECHNITGSVEYLLRVEARDLVAYKTFHTDVLGALPQVATIQTHVVMASPKDERA
jgi:Lrp/AsnC family leucine-responsive transcriptional regulator